MIREMNNTIQFSILTNGSPGEFFMAKRGLQKGDPLLPYLFNMVDRILGRKLLAMVSQGKIIRVQPTMTLLLEVM